MGEQGSSEVAMVPGWRSVWHAETRHFAGTGLPGGEGVA